GLDQDRVIAPYATAMAAMLAPKAAVANFQHLSREGGEGEYGYYEAIDYTPARVPKGSRSVVVRSYMAHHQGMSLVGLDNAILADVMTGRFRVEPMVRAIDLLLQERITRDAPIVEGPEAHPNEPPETDAESSIVGGARAPLSRRLTTPGTHSPRTQL